MEPRVASLIAGLMAIAALAIPDRLPKQAQAETSRHHHYKLFDIGTLGGPNSFLIKLKARRRI